MTKKDLIDKIADEFSNDKDGKKEFTKGNIKELIEFIFDEFKKSLVSGEEVSIAGFGKFVTTERAARKGRNPQTGEAIDIPASTVAKFRVSKHLKESLN